MEILKNNTNHIIYVTSIICTRNKGTSHNYGIYTNTNSNCYRSSESTSNSTSSTRNLPRSGYIMDDAALFLSFHQWLIFRFKWTILMPLVITIYELEKDCMQTAENIRFLTRNIHILDLINTLSSPICLKTNYTLKNYNACLKDKLLHLFSDSIYWYSLILLKISNLPPWKLV